MKSKKILALALASVMCLSAACSGSTDDTEPVTSADTEVSEETDVTEGIDEPDETEAEGSVVVRAASVPEEDIVYANLDGMTAEEVIKNLNNLAKIDSNTTFDNYGDRFQVDSPCVWCSSNDNQGNTSIGSGWGFAQDEDGGFHTELNGHAYLEWVGFRKFSSDGDNELIIRFYVSEDIANDVKDALKEQLLSGGYVVGTDSDLILMVHDADDVSISYSITYAGRGYFRVEMPCSVMK